MSENVYERHDDEMSDDVGDLKNSTMALPNIFGVNV